MTDRSGLKSHDNWKTPKWLYNELDAEFHFDFDPCPLNHDISLWDGLEIEWLDSNFVNPPYSKGEDVCKKNCKKKSCIDRGHHISKRICGKEDFIKKSYEEWQKGKTVVLLIPAAVDTDDFHDYIYPYAELRFPRGRIAFEGLNAKGEYVTTRKGMHASMICIFRKEVV